MSIHVCRCEHNGRTEYHLRYPGMTEGEAQKLADAINGGELVEGNHPLRKDAERYRYLRNRVPAEVLGQVKSAAGCWIDGEDDEGVLMLLTGDDADAAIDAAMSAAPAVGAA